jgi:hypothetical protein
MELKEEKNLKRIDSSYIIHEISHILHIEKGIIYTIIKLLVSPGKTINEFLNFNRSKVVKPIVFLIISTLIYNLTNSQLHFQDDAPEVVINNDIVTIIENWFSAHFGYYNLILGFFVALILRLAYFKRHYNIYEILVLMCYVIAMDMLLAAIIGTFTTIFSLNFMNFFQYPCLIYNTYALANFFGKNKWYNYIIAIICFLVGTIIIVLLPDIARLLIKLFTNK